ncbi:MAG: carboxylesterase family protein [Kiritimatiellaeota bacterium]|nr:carboxylesterase family protein [Kiritimatiellota bacterium]
MLRPFIVMLLFVAAGAGFAAAEVNVLGPVRVMGGLIAGVPNQAQSVVAFKGVSYAAAPVGDLRWRGPQPPVPWTSVRKATHYGASCLQRPPSGKPPYYEAFLANEPTSEDCLFLNIWAPVKADAGKSAVLVYIHGGMYQTGSGSAPVFDGEALAEKGIVVVTLNFRIGVLAGFTHPRQPPDWPEAVPRCTGFRTTSPRSAATRPM